MTARWLVLLLVACGCGTCGNAPARAVTHEDLARWSEPVPRLGLDCLDARLIEELRATSAEGRATRTRIAVNPPVEVAEQPDVLPIYVVEEAEPGLSWLRNEAFTTDVVLPRRSELVSVILVDRNLLRVMGARLGLVIAEMQAETDRLLRPGPAPGTPGARLARTFMTHPLVGFGAPPAKRLPIPEAVRRYCANAPGGGDLIVVALLRDAVLWTLRHELHHAWNPDQLLAPSTLACPSPEQLERTVRPELEADAFASRALERDDVTGLLAPWRDRFDAWVEDYGDPAEPPLDLAMRRYSLATVVAHHEGHAIVARQEWIAAGRTREMMRRAGHPELASGIDFYRALGAARRCPSWRSIEQQCAACERHPGGCAAAAQAAWSCRAMQDLDERVAAEQDEAPRSAADHPRSEGFRVRLAKERGNELLPHHEVALAGGSPLAQLVYIRGARSPSPAIEQLNLRDAMYEQGFPVVVGGLFVDPPRRAAGSVLVLEAMYRWELDGFRRRCRGGDATACLREGYAHYVEIGTEVDPQAAHLRLAQACGAQVAEACALDEQLRRQLRILCREGLERFCDELRAIEAR